MVLARRDLLVSIHALLHQQGERHVENEMLGGSCVSIHALLHQQGEQEGNGAVLRISQFQSTPCFISRANRPTTTMHFVAVTFQSTPCFISRANAKGRKTRKR